MTPDHEALAHMIVIDPQGDEHQLIDVLASGLKDWREDQRYAHEALDVIVAAIRARETPTPGKGETM